MDNQQQYQNVYSDEIDLVDLFVVLLRRKTIIILTMVLCAIISGLFFYSKPQKNTITAGVLVGAIKLINEEGVLTSHQLMSYGNSVQLFEDVLLPVAMSKSESPIEFDVDIKKMGERNGDNQGNKLFIATVSTTQANTNATVDALNTSTQELVNIQNVIFEKELARLYSQKHSLELELELSKSTALVENLKRPLVAKTYANQRSIDRSTNEMLLNQRKQILLQAANIAKKALAQQEQLVASEKEILEHLAQLKPILELRRKELVEQLAELREARNRMLDSLQAGNETDVLSTEALIAIDGRDGRFRESLTAIDMQLFKEIPLKETNAKLKIETGLLNVLNLQQNLAVAEHDVSVFDVEQEYLQNSLKEEREAIIKELAGFEYEQEATVKRLEQDLAGLELILSQPTKSESIEAVVVEEHGKSLFIYIIASMFMGVFLGCFLAFFLELLAKAKVRAAELA